MSLNTRWISLVVSVFAFLLIPNFAYADGGGYTTGPNHFSVVVDWNTPRQGGEGRTFFDLISIPSREVVVTPHLRYGSMNVGSIRKTISDQPSQTFYASGINIQQVDSIVLSRPNELPFMTLSWSLDVCNRGPTITWTEQNGGRRIYIVNNSQNPMSASMDEVHWEDIAPDQDIALPADTPYGTLMITDGRHTSEGATCGKIIWSQADEPASTIPNTVYQIVDNRTVSVGISKRTDDGVNLHPVLMFNGMPVKDANAFEYFWQFSSEPGIVRGKAFRGCFTTPPCIDGYFHLQGISLGRARLQVLVRSKESGTALAFFDYDIEVLP